MKGWVLDKEEKACADWIIKNFFKYESTTNYRKAPCTFVKTPDDFKDTRQIDIAESGCFVNFHKGFDKA